MAESFVDLNTVLAFVSRTVDRGAPTRVAISRAAKRYRIHRSLVVAACRSQEHGRIYDSDLPRL